MGGDIGPERLNALALRASLRFSSVRQDAFRCVCQDSGFIEEEGSPNTVIPCSRCNASTYDRWMRGEYRAYDGGPRRGSEQTPEASERRAERDRFGSRR